MGLFLKPALAAVRYFRRQKRLHHDLVRLHADGNDGQQGIFRWLQLLRLAFLDYRQVSGTGIKHQQIILILRERQRVGMGPYREIRDDLPEINVVDRDVIRPEVRDIQARVIKRHHAASRLSADEIAARNFVARSLDDGDGAGIEIEGDQFSAVRLERKAHRRFSDIEERQQLV